MATNDNVPPEAGETPPENNDQSFGFDAKPRPERYNTEFLVAKMSAEERRARLIIVGIAVAIVVAVGAVLAFSGEKKPAPLQPEQPANAAPAAPAAAPVAPAAAPVAPAPAPTPTH